MTLFGGTSDNRGEIRSELARSVTTPSILSPRAVVLRVAAWLHFVAELRRSRRALLDMTDDQLRDIGVSRTDADREGRRSFYIR